MGSRMAKRSISQLLLGFWLPAVLCAALVLFVGSRPNLKPPLSFANSDKLAHIAEYMVLGLMLTRAVRASGPAPLPAALIAVSLGILVGTTDELTQAHVPGRSCSGFDLLADAIGLALAPLAIRAFTRAREA